MKFQQSKTTLLNNLKTSLLTKTIDKYEILSLISETHCYFCSNPVSEKEYYQTSFWNQNKEDKRLICYICLKYSYKRDLLLISESKRELFLEYEKQGLFK
jgi:hypothetical protein